MPAGLVVCARTTAVTHLPRAKLSNSDQYGGGDLVRFLMFPKSEHRPAGSAQLCRRISIPGDVSAQLLRPVRRVGPRNGPMLWAGMPVATIDKHGDALLSEDYVSGTTEGWFGTMGDPETKAGGVQPSSNRQLRRSVPGPVSLHDLPGGGTACPAHVTLHCCPPGSPGKRLQVAPGNAPRSDRKLPDCVIGRFGKELTTRLDLASGPDRFVEDAADVVRPAGRS
jgi:hypothetical protein